MFSCPLPTAGKHIDASGCQHDGEIQERSTFGRFEFVELQDYTQENIDDDEDIPWEQWWF